MVLSHAHTRKWRMHQVTHMQTHITDKNIEQIWKLTIYATATDGYPSPSPFGNTYHMPMLLLLSSSPPQISFFFRVRMAAYWFGFVFSGFMTCTLFLFRLSAHSVDRVWLRRFGICLQIVYYYFYVFCFALRLHILVVWPFLCAVWKPFAFIVFWNLK